MPGQPLTPSKSGNASLSSVAFSAARFSASERWRLYPGSAARWALRRVAQLLKADITQADAFPVGYARETAPMNESAGYESLTAEAEAVLAVLERNRRGPPDNGGTSAWPSSARPCARDTRQRRGGLEQRSRHRGHLGGLMNLRLVPRRTRPSIKLAAAGLVDE